MKWIKQFKTELDEMNISSKTVEQKYKEVFDVYKVNNWNTQVVKNYFIKFIQAKDLTNYMDRCVQLHHLLPRRGITLKRMLLLHGDKEGNKKWTTYCDRQAYTNTQEYKNMNDEEFNLYNKNRSTTHANMISRHGEEEGNKKWTTYCDRQAYTNTLEYFIEQYGKNGKMKWNSINKMKSHSLDSYIEKYGDVLGSNKYHAFCNKYRPKYSKISQELFLAVDKSLNLMDLKLYYAIKNKEFGKYNKDLKKYNYYDFVIPSLKICVEYNGNLFHANPTMFNECDYPNPFDKTLSAKEIWKNDEIKNKILVDLGYNIIVIWEDEYLNDKNETVEKLCKYIRKEYEYFKN